MDIETIKIILTTLSSFCLIIFGNVALWTIFILLLGRQNRNKRAALHEFASETGLVLKSDSLEGIYRDYSVYILTYIPDDMHSRCIAIKHNTNFNGYILISSNLFAGSGIFLVPSIKSEDDKFNRNFTIQVKNTSKFLITHILTDSIKNRLYDGRKYGLFLEITNDYVSYMPKLDNIYLNKKDLKNVLDLVVEVTDRLKSIQ